MALGCARERSRAVEVPQIAAKGEEDSTEEPGGHEPEVLVLGGTKEDNPFSTDRREEKDNGRITLVQQSTRGVVKEGEDRCEYANWRGKRIERLPEESTVPGELEDSTTGSEDEENWGKWKEFSNGKAHAEPEELSRGSAIRTEGEQRDRREEPGINDVKGTLVGKRRDKGRTRTHRRVPRKVGKFLGGGVAKGRRWVRRRHAEEVVTEKNHDATHTVLPCKDPLHAEETALVGGQTVADSPSIGISRSKGNAPKNVQIGTRIQQISPQDIALAHAAQSRTGRGTEAVHIDNPNFLEPSSTSFGKPSPNHAAHAVSLRVARVTSKKRKVSGVRGIRWKTRGNIARGYLLQGASASLTCEKGRHTRDRRKCGRTSLRWTKKTRRKKGLTGNGTILPRGIVLLHRNLHAVRTSEEARGLGKLSERGKSEVNLAKDKKAYVRMYRFPWSRRGVRSAGSRYGNKFPRSMVKGVIRRSSGYASVSIQIPRIRARSCAGNSGQQRKDQTPRGSGAKVTGGRKNVSSKLGECSDVTLALRQADRAKAKEGELREAGCAKSAVRKKRSKRRTSNKFGGTDPHDRVRSKRNPNRTQDGGKNGANARNSRLFERSKRVGKHQDKKTPPNQAARAHCGRREVKVQQKEERNKGLPSAQGAETSTFAL